MAQLQVEVEPGEVGFDAARLGRVDTAFQRYVDDGKLPGWLIAVTRHGKLAHLSTYGHRDIEADLPVEADTLFRIYSMTKPITSVAAMMLYEEGRFALKDPISRWLPEFADLRVYTGGGSDAMETEAATEPIRVWHLLTHTAGLTYGFHRAHPVDGAYRDAGYDLGAPKGATLADACAVWAGLPLLFQPGTEWNYSVASDVLGRFVEVVSGQSLDAFFQERILGPLGMVDTAFSVADDQRHRLAGLYVPGAEQRATRFDEIGPVAHSTPDFLSGGGGLVSSAADYLRFVGLLRRGGELDGVRLLSNRTVAYMTQNHLPGGVDLEEFGRQLFSETTYDGVGFGLGFAVTQDAVKNRVLASVGEYTWGGAASTTFWVDPAEDVTAVFLTQLLPSSTWPIRSQLKALVLQALVD
ncbi:serine hydrolase [Aquihabitans sp. G128]|uniref:serine hydrolase domain-containing protein n=1 Tax=Aquihabitans sp. G128 TaxID=2849779 RepID=UPI0020B3C8C6|nr:serine hydrolase domain-containing protein [Aquihabitans sp. G128]